MRETKNAIADFREVVDKYPEASEARLAKEELQKLGASSTAPAPTRRKTR
jgi:outer membrane protein assembly factor BamD (BamD/ComL family)